MPMNSSQMNLAIQLYSVRSLLAERFQETLRALAEIGFKNITGIILQNSRQVVIF